MVLASFLASKPLVLLELVLGRLGPGPNSLPWGPSGQLGPIVCGPICLESELSEHRPKSFIQKIAFLKKRGQNRRYKENRDCQLSYSTKYYLASKTRMIAGSLIAVSDAYNTVQNYIALLGNIEPVSYHTGTFLKSRVAIGKTFLI